MIAMGMAVNAQEVEKPTSKGKFVIEANTGSGGTSGTHLSLYSTDGHTGWSLGLNGGYFVIDNLAIKTGLGYSGYRHRFNGREIYRNSFVYAIGAEYYFIDKIPVSIDYSGNDNGINNLLGLQAGYVWFLAENMSVKPILRYNIGLGERSSNSFQGLIGFALYF